MINKGSTALPYEPYFEGKRLEFNVCNENLFNEDDVNFVVGILDDNGQPTGLTSSKYTEQYYAVESNSSYVLSGTITSQGNGTRIYYYDENKNWISRSGNDANSPRIFITPENCKYIRIQVTASITLKTNNVMLKKGTIATPYKEHKEQLIPFPLQDGQKLMEGDYLADDGIHHVRGEVTLNGSEMWSKSNLAFQTLSTVTPNKGELSFKSLSDYFIHNYYPSAITSNIQDGEFGWNSTKSLTIRYDECSTTAEFKTWLSTHNVKVQYNLEEEIVESYTPAQAEAYNQLKNLMLYKGVNHIWTETDGLEPNMQLTYYKSNKERLNNIEARLELLEN